MADILERYKILYYIQAFELILRNASKWLSKRVEDAKKLSKKSDIGVKYIEGEISNVAAPENS